MTITIILIFNTLILGGQLRASESMNLHEAISTLADPCLDLIRRVKEVEKICSENSLSLKSHSGVIGAQSVTLENHKSQIEGLMALRLRSKLWNFKKH